jgi:hypothetical protein
MRNFINLIEKELYESRGLGARKPGEEFIGATNPEQKIYFDTVTFYPVGGVSYDSYEQMVEELKRIVTSYKGTSIDLIKKFTLQDRAFGIAEFTGPNKEKYAWVKPYKSVKLDPTLNDWNNQTGIPGFKYNSKAAAKTQVGLTPQDILTKPSELTRQDIVAQISDKFGADSPLTLVAQAVASGQPFPITIAAVPSIGFSAFRDYFCELLHPMALQTGKVTGNAQQAAARFLGPNGFADCSINFGTDKTEGLSDSILISQDGKKIKVSSKGATGAEASVKNIIDVINELKAANPQLAKKHKKIIDIIDKVVEGKQANAPLNLGVEFNIISESDANAIRQMKNMAPTDLKAVDTLDISSKLKNLMLQRETKDKSNVNLYFHSLAAVAHKVAKHINENTNFSDAASEILNNAALIQVYTIAQEQTDRWTLKEFNSKWPSNDTTGVLFSAGKTYYSTGIKGNFTFKILRNGAVPTEEDNTEIGDLPENPTKSNKQTVPLDLRPTAVKNKDKKVNVGREKR